MSEWKQWPIAESERSTEAAHPHERRDIAGTPRSIYAAMYDVPGIRLAWLRERTADAAFDLRIQAHEGVLIDPLTDAIHDLLRYVAPAGIAYTLEVTNNPADLAAWVLEEWPG